MLIDVSLLLETIYLNIAKPFQVEGYINIEKMSPLLQLASQSKVEPHLLAWINDNGVSSNADQWVR